MAGLDTNVPVVLAVVPLALWTQLGRARAMALVFGATWIAWILSSAVGNILPDRLMLYVYLLAGIPLAYLINDVLRLRTWPRIGGVAMALIALAPLVPVVPYPSTSLPIPAFFTAEVDNIVPADSVALVTTTLGPFHSTMVWQTVSRMRFKMPGGYVFVPGLAGPTLNPPTTVVSQVVDSIEKGQPPAYTEDLRTRLSAQLRAWHVQTVIVGPGNRRTGLMALFTWLLGRGPELLGGVAVWPNVVAEFEKAVSRVGT